MIRHLKDGISRLREKIKTKEDPKFQLGANNDISPSDSNPLPVHIVPTLDVKGSRRRFDTRYKYITNNDNLTIYSYGNKPAISVELKSSVQYRDSDFANCSLPSACKTHNTTDGTVIVGVGGVGRSTTAVVSNSFGSCTPIIARFSDGSIGMYHAAFAPLNDPMRAQLLNAEPTDIFVVTKDGFGAHIGRQTAQAIDTVQQAPPGSNVHIVTVPRATLAVEARPGKIVIFSTTIRQHDLAHGNQTMGRDPERVVSDAGKDQNFNRIRSGDASEVCQDTHKPAELHLPPQPQDLPGAGTLRSQSENRRAFSRDRESACR